MKRETFLAKATDLGKNKNGCTPSPAPIVNNHETKGLTPTPAPAIQVTQSPQPTKK